MQILILAKSTTEANSYAKKAGLPRFTYRAVRNASAIRGIRKAEVHILPSFTTRIDRHNILAALQWAKTLEVFYVDPADLPEPPDPRGELTERQLEVAFRYNALRDLAEYEEDMAALKALEDKLATKVRVTAVSDDVEPPASHLQLVDRVKPEEPSGNEAGETESSEDPAPAPKQRRRSRCKECSELHFPEEPCAAKADLNATGDFF